MGLRSKLRGFDAQLGHLHDACTSLPQKSLGAIKWLEIKIRKKRLYGPAGMKDYDNITKRALMLQVNRQRKQGKPKQTWRRKFKESVKRIWLEEAANRIKWREGEKEIAAEEMRCTRLRETHRIETG